MAERRLFFITHADVEIDPDVPVPEWGLNPRGRKRHQAFARHPCLAGVRSVWSSTERKALDGADITAQHLKVPQHSRVDLHENDRSSTGYLKEAEFQATADAFFANPDDSVRGWEPAADAQARVVAALQDVIAKAPSGDIAVIGHGGIGCLLLCHVLGEPISRRNDQAGRGGGNYVSITLPQWSLGHHWRDIAPEQGEN